MFLVVVIGDEGGDETVRKGNEEQGLGLMIARVILCSM